MYNYFHSSSLLGGLVCLILIIGIAVIVFKRWSTPYTTAAAILKGLRGRGAPAPARAPATRKGWSTLLRVILTIVVLAFAAWVAWFAYAHWDEWFPKDVQCGVMSETHQSCVVKPGETATITIPVVKHPEEHNICLVLDGVLDHLWYTTSLSGTKREYSADSPPKNVTSYTFDAGARGAKITYFFAKKPC